MNRFEQKLDEISFELRKSKIEILQVNLGKLCNLTCFHCHVESGPTEIRENMDRQTAEAVVRLMDRLEAHTIDLTGGAPELNPHFRYLITEASKRDLQVMDRCNLTAFFEPGMENLPEFLSAHHVEIVASLPCYAKENVDKQRGKGTFELSIQALQKLNRLGYGAPEGELVLNLVYNPVGPHLPPSQEKLEHDYKTRLWEDYGIRFHRLYALTNMPITRYAKYLKAFGQYESYVDLLFHSFNPETLQGLMCRNTLNVGWDGRLYDCDFNQMLSLELPMTVFNVMPEDLENWEILTGDHCFGCTAGAGSTCQGAIT